MNNRMTAEEIFHAAREKSDSAERACFLDGACGNDVSLRAKVEALLKADAEAGEFLQAAKEAPQTPLATAPTLATTPRDQAGDMFGRYKLLQQIGEGGFGVVYMAEQREPVKRRLALKVIKLGMDTRQVIARFEAERQALAMMDHPNIAKVLDAGATESGRLYFVMEYIKGVPILEYCDTDRLDTKARLELFSQVCNAIQHAHQKGIIHRDIKPNNVLVTMHDGVPVPKVIDFGIAKATSAELTAKTLFTEHRQMIGTPAYMSPEQAEMSGLDIDTRSDIYSLGVLLYELLTGTTPFDSTELLSKGFAEMMRIIREVEPHKPSTRLSSLGDTGTRTAQQRRAIDPRKLSQTLKGDLDWIVMKCLEKDRTRRYETANGLAADIKRHLSDEPVTAGAPSTGYRLRKFVKRNRPQVIAAGIVAAVLVLGVISTTMGMVWALKEKTLADAERTKAIAAVEAEAKAKLDADRQRDSAIAAQKDAETQRDKAEKVSQFMGMMLSGAGHWMNKGYDTTLLKEMMDFAATKIEEGVLKSAPEGELTLRMMIGGAYKDLAEYDAARKILEPAVALARRINLGDNPKTAWILKPLASLLQATGDLAGAEPLLRESLEMSKRVNPGDSDETVRSLDVLSFLLMERGELAEAERLKREALEMAKRLNSPWLEIPLMNLGFVLQNRGDLAGAGPLFRDALEMARRDHPSDQVPVAFALYGQGRQLQARGNLAEAESLYRESLEMLQRFHLGDHKHVAMILASLASLLQERGDLESAEPLFRESLEMREHLLGKENRDTLFSVILMGGLRVAQGEYADALTLLAPIEGKAREVFTGGNAYKLASLLMNLGKARAALAKTKTDFAAAEANLLEAHDNFVKAPGPFPQDRRDSVQALVDLYDAWDKIDPENGYDAKAADWRAKLDTTAP
jgi:serine/threonine protein kinase/tetratricopeptide (TPR) repeat protein